MNGTNYFKLSFVYKAMDEEKEVIIKKEFLAECTCYTEAEKIAYFLIKEYRMNHIEHPKYDIKKLPKIEDIKYNECFSAEEHSNLGMVELYFENEDQHLFEVNLKLFYTSDRGKIKCDKQPVYIPAVSANDAINKSLKMYSNLTAYDDIKVVKSSMFELIDAIFVTSTTYNMMKRQ